MHLSEAEFFRQVTIRICGSLEVKKALFDTYRYLCQYIPVDEISYTHFVPEMGAILFVACATAEGGQDLGHAPMPLPDRLSNWLKQDISRTDCYVMNRPGDNPLSPVITKFRGMSANTSILVVRLLVEDQFLGSFNLAIEGLDRYTDAHIKLISLVREPLAIALANGLQHREVIRLKELQEEDNQYLKNELNSRFGRTIVGADFGLKQVMAQIRQVAGGVSPVLLQGETGTGKEIIAHAIHHFSPRNSGPFIAVNCGAIPGGLMDSELFGHEKGSFTGAANTYRGRFERADKGTIFLDEIGELPLEAQVRLLRVLQEREIERVGASEPIKTDIRVIAATHRNLDTMVSNGSFRQDLLFRLNVFPITIPPLRDRKTDIPALSQHFLQQKSRDLGIRVLPEMTKPFLDQLLAYEWPGNVRELENYIERTLILSRGGPLSFETLDKRLRVLDKVTPDQETSGFLSLDEAMAQHIKKGLDHCGGRIEGPKGLSNLLDIKPNTLRARMRKLGIAYGRKSLDMVPGK